MQATHLIDRKQYPNLDAILWDRAERVIPANEAFHAYETRWSYIAHDTFTPKEKRLIEQLTNTIGNGLFLAKD